MPATLAPTWDVTSAAGQSPSVVRIRNLQATTRIGLDAWSRDHRLQPLLVSATVSLARPSAASSASDRVDVDTVHYGLLSKAILSVLDEVDGLAKDSGGEQPVTLRGVLDLVWVRLTGNQLNGGAAKGTREEPFLDRRAVRCVSVTLRLPKASLVGGCVSLTGTSLFDDGQARMAGVCLELSNIRVPTLIGVNSNERQARQVVVADVEIDCFEVYGDVYPCLEQAIYEVCCVISSTLPFLPLSRLPRRSLHRLQGQSAYHLCDQTSRTWRGPPLAHSRLWLPPSSSPSGRRVGKRQRASSRRQMIGRSRSSLRSPSPCRLRRARVSNLSLPPFHATDSACSMRTVS